MKVYFTASVRGKKDFDENYDYIYNVIEDLGHKNIDDLILRIDADGFYKGSHKDQVKLYKQTIDDIKKCDVVVLEVSIHSLSMGFVMQKALELGKPVVSLYMPGCDPYFAMGVDNEKLQVIEYSKSNLKKVLSVALVYAQDQMDTRFNFFISPKICNYLDWIAKKKKTPRAVYLRRLIEKEMDNNKEYSKA